MTDVPAWIAPLHRADERRFGAPGPAERARLHRGATRRLHEDRAPRLVLAGAYAVLIVVAFALGDAPVVLGLVFGLAVAVAVAWQWARRDLLVGRPLTTAAVNGLMVAVAFVGLALAGIEPGPHPLLAGAAGALIGALAGVGERPRRSSA